MSNIKFLSFLILCTLLGLGGTALPGNPPFITDPDESDYIYGKGVHAFFDRNYEDALNILSRAEEIKSLDPRPYYFLGLAHLRQKRTEQADLYFKKAAQLEYSRVALRDYAVAESLRRIQGTERLRIENIRTEERTAARIKNQIVQEARYGTENAAARNALFQSLQPVRETIVVPQEVHTLGENAFGVKPIDPIGTADVGTVIQRTEIAPFGGAVVSVTEAVPASPVVQEPSRSAEPTVPVIERRVYVNPLESTPPVVEIPTAPSPSANPLRSLQSDAAKQFGKTLGSLFSR